MKTYYRGKAEAYCGVQKGFIPYPNAPTLCARSLEQGAIASVANAIFQARLSSIWGEGTTACASDSKKFGAWDQNLMAEWHIRYGGRGGDDLLAHREEFCLYLFTTENLFISVRGQNYCDDEQDLVSRVVVVVE